MKTIDTLCSDINGLFSGARDGVSTVLEEQVLANFGAAAALHVADSLTARRAGGRKDNTLYMSEIGKPCHRQVWYSYHMPASAEPILPHTLFKFIYGDLIEEATLMLAEAAGHKVERRQEPVQMHSGEWEVRGKIDAVIDDVLVDVKSCSPFGYKKFAEGLTDDNDSFGYRLQLSAYNLALPLKMDVTDQGFLAVDKQNGHIGYFPQEYVPVETRVETLVFALEHDRPPTRRFKLIPDGKSGNEKLCTECSYCPYKFECWKDANSGHGLRGFSYSTGPVFLGTVVRTPNVPELSTPINSLGAAYHVPTNAWTTTGPVVPHFPTLTP